MRTAILIGFEYTDKDKKLPGIIIDLYQVYSFLKKNKWLDDEIFIMTDIIKDETTEILRNSILEKIVDVNVLSFIEDCKEKKQYILFKHHNHYNNFLSLLNEKNQMSDLFIYYTGHCKNGNIILPNNSLVSLDIFREELSHFKKVICVMDCCEGGVDLPFILNENVYRCRYNLSENMFVQSDIICLSSSLENENAIATKSGSYFTRYLFKILESESNSKLNLTYILKKLNSDLKNIKQTANISSSFPRLLQIPQFLFSGHDISINIFLSHIIVSKVLL